MKWFENICVFYINFVIGFWIFMGISMATVLIQSSMK